MALTRERARETGEKYIGTNELYPVIRRVASSGKRHFSVLVSHENKVVDVTNYFARACDLPLVDKGTHWETSANPGYTLATWVNEKWRDWGATS